MNESENQPLETNKDRQQQPSTDNSAYRKGTSQTITEDPTPGDRNQNPTEISFFELIAEDYRTFDKNLFDPALWAVVIHRFGNWRMDIRPRLLRAPFSVLYKILHNCMIYFYGIDLGYTVKLGRRVRLWHHGGMFLGAISIGNDVTIRHNTTMGVLHQSQTWNKPIIEDRVDIGAGVCILGNVVVGHDSVIGANSVVVRSFPPHSTIFGVPARPVKMKMGEE